MDNPILFSVCAFLGLMSLCSWAGYRIFYKPGKLLKQLGNPVITEGPAIVAPGTPVQPGTIVSFLRDIGQRVPSSDTEIASLRGTLIQAGFRSENAAPVFFGLRIVSAMALLILSLIMQPGMSDNPMLRVMLVASGAMCGWILPRFFLEKKVKKRREIVRLSLPDALDMIIVSVEAGLGLDQSLQYVGRELAISHPQLSEELSLVTLEMRAGKRRADALRNFADRTGEPEVRKLVAIMIQNDRFGTSMGESLRTHSDYLRVRRRQEAEERAGKVGVKLVFPIFFFILPSMVIVSAGPGLLQIFKDLFPMMKKLG
jgi:tight adherence protein C